MRQAVVFVGAWAMLAALAGSAHADLPGGSPAEWLRRGGSVLVLDIRPGEARVHLDGDAVHPGPILVTPGIHMLLVQASGRQDHREVLRIAPGRLTRKTVSLAAHVVTGRVELRTSPVRARILLDGQLAGETPRTLTLTTGRHRLQLVAAGYRAARRTIRVPRSATLALRIDLVPERRRGRRPRVALYEPARSTFAAKMKSLSLRPATEWVHTSIVSRPHDTCSSGW